MVRFLFLILFILHSFVFALTFEESLISAKKNNKLLESINLNYRLNSFNFASQVFGSTLYEDGSAASGIIPQVRLRKVLMVDKMSDYQISDLPKEFKEKISHLNHQEAINAMQQEGLPLEIEVGWSTKSIKDMLYNVPKVHKVRQQIHNEEQKLLLESIISTYFSTLNALKAIELTKLQYEYNKQIYDSFKKRSDLGAATKIQLNLAYCNMLSAEQKYHSAMYRKESAFAEFKQNIGIDPCDLKLPTKKFIKFDKLDELKELAIKKNYDLKSYEKMQFAYSGLLMSHLMLADVNLAFHHTLHGLPKRYDHSLQVALTLPINPSTVIDLIKIRTLLKKNAVDAQYHRESMLLKLDSAWGDWNMCKAEFKANKEMRQARQDMVSMVKKQHSLGGASIEDLLKSQSELAQSDMELYKSISNLWIQYFSLIQLSGMLDFNYLLQNTQSNPNDCQDEMEITSRLIVF